MIKKTIALVAISAMLAIVLPGCGKSSASGSPEESSPSVSSSPTQSSAGADFEKDADPRDQLEGKLDSATFYKSVPNDVTGRWRCLVYDSEMAPQDFALEYYQAYFTDDEETHALVNLREQTTANVSVVGNDLCVKVHEYVNGEEHDAKELFSGDVIAEYYVNKDSREIEQVR